MNLAWLWIFPVLGSLVLIHELGHFVTARLLGIRVEEFGLGFPPRMFAIRHNNIDYSLNWLPIGGFVKILGENGESSAPDSFGAQPAWKRIIVLAAGSTMNILMALVLLIALGILGERVADNTKVGFAQITPNNPAARANLQVGDLLLAVNGTPIDSTNAAQDLLAGNTGKTVQLTIDHAGVQRTIQVTLNPSKPALGVVLDAAVAPVRAAAPTAGSAAAQSGLRAGDVVTAVNGKPTPSTLAINSTLATLPDGSVMLTVMRNGATVDLQGQVSKGQLGGFAYQIPSHIQTYSAGEAVVRGFAEVGDLVRRIADGLVTLVTGLFTGRSEAGGVTGVVGIAQLTGEVAQESGATGLLKLTALLGINLFLINLLPLPALDGGRLLFIFVELLRGGRKIAPEKEGMVHAIGLATFLVLMLIIAFLDVQNLGKSILHP